MKIALITTMKYGLTQFVFRDIAALQEQGHLVKIFPIRNQKGLYQPRPDWQVFPVPWMRLLFLQVALLIRRPKAYLAMLGMALRTNSLVDFLIAVAFSRHMDDVEVIYSYFGDHKLFIGYYCKQMTGIPLVVTIRAYELHRNPNPMLFVTALAACDRIVTITEYNKELLVKEYGVPAEQIDIVRQIVDLEQFQDRRKIKILIVGYFAEKKGHEILFRAIKQMERDDIEVWVVGDVTPSVREVDCRRLAAEIGVTDQVAFFGEQSGTALRTLYRECDIFCLPSHTDSEGNKEGFPNVIAEAMAFSKPVVSTRHAGIPEVIDAVLVEEKNVEQLAAALHRVCDSAALRRQLGERNRRVVEELYSPANSERLAQILQCYATGTPSAVQQPATRDRSVVRGVRDGATVDKVR